MPKADSTDVIETEDDAQAPADEIDAPSDGSGDDAGETPADPAQTDAEGAASDDAPADEADDSVVVTIGEESPPSEDEENRAPAWVRDLRKSNREKDRRIRELEGKLQTPAAAPAAVGDKPTLESCDFDAETFEKALDAWHARKRDADAEAETKRKAEESSRQQWQERLNTYGKAKAELKVRDFEDAEGVAQDALSVVQQGVILNGADSPALVVYALGKNPKKAKELAAIADPVKFAFAVAKLETQLKVTPRKSAPPPEKVVRSSVPGSVASAANLEKLTEEARRTGDYSKVFAAKRGAAKQA